MIILEFILIILIIHFNRVFLQLARLVSDFGKTSRSGLLNRLSGNVVATIIFTCAVVVIPVFDDCTEM